MHPLITQLLSIPSVSPNDAGCQTVLKQHLAAAGFNNTDVPFGDIDNLWATYGNDGPTLVFAGHTDVVPSGPLEAWTFDPFTPTVQDDKLYARGAADMKIALCCMITAAERFIKQHPQFPGRIAFLITGCEEITTQDGTKRVIDNLIDQGESLDWCIVGEASSLQTIGDQIRVGRRGSLSGELTIHGKQGHIAYPENAMNPIHDALPALDQLAHKVWDNGNEFFAPTSFQLSNINAGTGANNIIPGQLQALFNFRYSPASTMEQLKQQVHAILDQQSLNYDLEWTESGEPFLSEQGKLLNATQQAIQITTGQLPKLDTGGGTSDARFIAPHGIETIELGFCNESIHQVDEHVPTADIATLEQCYYQVLKHLFINHK